MKLTDEEIRMKAAEICVGATALVMAHNLGNLTEIDYFGLCDSIVEYVKTGKKPEKIVVKR